MTAEGTAKGFGHKLGRVCWYLLLFFSVFGLAGMAFIAIKGAGKRAPLPNLTLEGYLAGAGIEAPMAILITRNKHEIFTYYKPTENDRDTAFPMGGLADLITATATLVMTDRNLIDLNEPVGAYVDDLPQAVGAIETKHLLNHTSGLTDTSPDAPVFTPGDEVRVSARNMTLLTQAIEAVTGQAAPAIITEEILTPLSMNDTRHENGAWETTLADLLRFEQSFYSNQVVSLKAKRDASRTARLNDGKRGRYHAGWEVRNYKGLRLERAGGASAALWRFPNKNFAALVLADLSVADGKVEDVARAIADIYLGREMPAPNLPFE